MEDEWEELQSPWRIEAAPLDDHFLIHHHRDAASVPPADSPPSSSASSSPTPPPDSPPSSASSSSGWRLRSRAAAATLRTRLWIVTAEVRRLASKAAIAGRFRKITGVVAAFLLCLLCRRLRSRWRRRSVALRDDSNGRLVVLLKEKDQTIGQLMGQIAEMNEALMERHRVPVIRVG